MQKIFAERNVKFGLIQMKTLGMVTQDGVYTNLGLLLSDQCVHTIKAAVFQGTTQSEFKDRKEFSGSLFRQMDEAYDFIDFRNQTHSTFDKLYRIDRRDYPETAVREALLNLLVHREYSFRASTFVSLYADRLEFTSIGGLVSGMSLKDVTMGIYTSVGTLNWQMQVNPEKGTPEEKVIAMTKQRGFITRKEVEILLGIGQSSCGRLLKK